MIENRKSSTGSPSLRSSSSSCQDKVYTGNSVNISSGGIFVTLLESSEIARESVCQCVFALNLDEAPLTVQAVVKRVVAMDPNPEIVPGIALNFVESVQNDLERLKEFMTMARQNFETALTLLASGEPILTSLEPLIQRMHLPPTTDLGDLRFQIERILKSIELVDANNSRIGTPPASPPR